MLMRIKGLGHPHSQTEGEDFIARFLLVWDVLLKQRAVLWDGSNTGYLLSLANISVFLILNSKDNTGYYWFVLCSKLTLCSVGRSNIDMKGKVKLLYHASRFPISFLWRLMLFLFVV